MADSSLNNLNYGRPGLITYDLDDRKWTFSRQPASKNLKQVAEWQLALPAATDLLPTGASTNATTTRGNVKRLTHDHLQLAAATRQLPELSAVSEAVTSAATTYDPLIGDLLSFGTVFLDKGGRPKRIAALPAGLSGDILRLVVLGRQKRGWGADRSVWLSGSSLQGADSGYWNEDAVPIQQVCFAQAESSNSFLAVRLASRTVLFRPSYHRGRQAAEPSTHYYLPPSVVSARPILNFTLDQTGGVPHADVAFNPDYQFQFGIVDQQCNWSVWQVERRAKRDEYSASCLIRGVAFPQEDTNPDGGDGWAKILWAGDSNTLLICNRRHISLISIEGESFKHLPVPPLIPQRSADWILDIKRHPRHRNRFIILSSARLFVAAVVTSSASVDSMAGQAGATILLSRRHYRGDEDLTLQLSVQTLVDNETCVFLSSRLNKLVQLYYLQDLPSKPSESPESVISFDPVAIDLVAPAAASITHMHLDFLEYGTRPQSQFNQSSAAAHSYLKNAVPFYQLTTALSDFSVLQTVLLAKEHDADPEPLAWSRTIPTNRSLYTSTHVGEMDDFVVPNGLLEAASPDLKLGSQAPQLLPPLDRLPHGMMDYTTIYDALVHSDYGFAVIDDSMSIDVITEKLKDMMAADVCPTGQGSCYIMEMFDASVGVSDIDEASLKIDGLFASDNPQALHALRRIAPLRVLHLPMSEEPSIATLYDTILQEWIAPLPGEVPVPMRQAKERLSRRVAAEVTLASARLSNKHDEPLPQPSVHTSGTMSLPFLPSRPGNGAHVDQALNTFPSQPTPPQSSVPSSSQRPSWPSLLAPTQASVGGPLSRLRKYLTINDDSSTMPTTIPPSVSEVLSHWQPGTDPSLYDWEATERALRTEDLYEADHELREKERKKRERREKRQRREDDLMRVKVQASSQPIYIQPSMPRSSPGPTFGGMAASSQIPIPMSSQTTNQFQSQGSGLGGFGGVQSMLPQSQVEPGRFGGRPDKKKKKGKSRVSGF